MSPIANEPHEDHPIASSSPLEHQKFEEDKAMCDVLCSLSSSTQNPGCRPEDDSGMNDCPKESKKKSSKCCPKQLQLPMFLSKTYHMIDRCDPEIATWSESGENFVVKNVEKFASHVLPLYFKHSNFSSFARQLNFYGFRKLRTDPILTSDVDPQTSCYVRFYHEKFQKDKPELLNQIKRATKTDQQSKDDVDSLKHEVAKLKEALSLTTAEYDRKLAELSYECNRRITAMNAEYDKLATLVHHLIAQNGSVSGAPVTVAQAPTASQIPDLLHSLSQVAAVLHPTQPAMNPLAAQLAQQQRQPAPTTNADGKRPATKEDDNEKPATKPRTS